MDDATKIIQSEKPHDIIGGHAVKTINPPVYSASTVLFDDYEGLIQHIQA